MRQFNTKTRLFSTFAAATAAAALAFGGATPALAWSSTVFYKVPAGCTGTWTGSSSISGSTMYASTTKGANGNCGYWVPFIGNVEAHHALAGGYTIGCFSTNGYCSHTMPRSQSATGGLHIWKDVSGWS